MAVRDKVITRHSVSSALEGAIEAHRNHFGSVPNLVGLESTGQDRQLADQIWVAIRVGKPFDAAAVTKDSGSRLG